MIYWQYFKYICEHKKNVFIEAWDMGLKWHAITHDLSKFRPCEFFPYAHYFYGTKEAREEYKLTGNYLGHKAKFEVAWKKHYTRNRHHWEHWTINWEDWTDLIEPHEMPVKYIKQMIADWKGMSRKFGGSAQEYYLKNYNKIKLHPETRVSLEAMLGLNDFPIDQAFAHMSLEEIIDRCIETKSCLNKLWFYGKFLGEIEIKYGVDLMEILKKERI